MQVPVPGIRLRGDPFLWWVSVIGLAATLALTIVLSSVLFRLATDSAREAAAAEARTSVETLVAHGLADEAALAHDIDGIDRPLEGRALDWYDAFVRENVLTDRVAHIVIYSFDGTILYSDMREYIGYAPVAGRLSDQEVATTIEPGGPTDHSHREGDPHTDNLIHVVTPLTLPSDTSPSAMLHVLQPGELVTEGARTLQRWILPTVGGGMLLSYVLLVIVLRDRSSLIRGQRDEIADRARELERTASAMRASERRFRALVANAADVTLTVDDDDLITYAGPSSERLWGLDPDQLVGRRIGDLVRPDMADHLRSSIRAMRVSGEHSSTLAFAIQRPDGAWVETEAVATNLRDDDAVSAIVLNCRDVSERRQHEAELSYLSLHDQLTGLPNGALFADRARLAFDQADRQGTDVAVISLDIDRFKFLNDELGRDGGDEVLAEVGRRLATAASAADTVARLGGGDFAVLVDNPTPGEPEELAQLLLDSVSQPMVIHGQELSIACSVGVAVRAHGDDLDDTLRAASVACDRAKRSGGGHVAVFDREHDARAVARLELEVEMRGVADRDELVMLLQPQLDVDSLELVGFEALVRWQHPHRGLLPPGAFIELAETTGEIVPIGRWMLKQALATVKRWEETHPDRPTTISVNASAVELREEDFVTSVWEALDDADVAPDRLCIEVTESMLLNKDEHAVERLSALQAIGVRVALDDFGTGYAALSYLRDLPIDTLKIDRSFVSHCHRDEKARGIIKAVVDLAQTLKLTVLAEGVEEREQLDALRSLECDELQGFLFSPPVPVAEAEAMLLDGSVEEQRPAA